MGSTNRLKEKTKPENKKSEISKLGWEGGNGPGIGVEYIQNISYENFKELIKILLKSTEKGKKVRDMILNLWVTTPSGDSIFSQESHIRYPARGWGFSSVGI